METQTKRDVQSEENRNKRPAAIEEWTTNKKRALSSNSGSPIASNGVESRALENAVQVDEPENEDELEVCCSITIRNVTLIVFLVLFSDSKRLLSFDACATISESLTGLKSASNNWKLH